MEKSIYKSFDGGNSWNIIGNSNFTILTGLLKTLNLIQRDNSSYLSSDQVLV